MNQAPNGKSRFVAGLLILVLMVPVSVTALPRPAHAFLGFEDIVADLANIFQSTIQNISGAATAVSTEVTAVAGVESAFSEGSVFTKEYVLDMIAYLVVDAAIDALMQSIINWANNGFEGSPAFVTNFREHMRNLGDNVAGEFFTQLATSNTIRSPFFDNMVGTLQRNYLRLTSFRAYIERARYTLGQYSQNDQAFTRGNFSQGGFGAWSQMWSNCHNNVFCAYAATRAELDTRVYNAQGNRARELSWGDGFLNSCEPAEASGEDTDSESAGDDTSTTEEGPSGDGDEDTGTGDETGDDPAATGEGEPASLAPTVAGGGPGCRTRTPNSLLNDITKRVLGSGLDRYISADELNEVVSAVVGGLINKVIGEGLGNAGSGSGARPGIGSGGAGSSAVPILINNLRELREKILVFQANWQKIANVATPAAARCPAYPAAQSAAERSGPALEKARTGLQKIDDLLEKLQALGSATQSSASAFSDISNEYNTLMSSGALPGPSEFSSVARDSRESASDEDAIRAGIPVSLYAQLKHISTGGACPAVTTGTTGG